MSFSGENSDKRKDGGKAGKKKKKKKMPPPPMLMKPTAAAAMMKEKEGKIMRIKSGEILSEASEGHTVTKLERVIREMLLKTRLLT